jgi:hypothetical protein
MRRWLAVPVVALLVVGACGGKDDVEGAEEEPVVADDVATAVDIARMSLPASVTQAEVADMLQDLCIAAGTGDIGPVVAELVAATDDPAQLPSSVDALAAGAGTYCPQDVDAVAARVRDAVAPTTTTVAPAAAATERTGGTGSTGSSSGRSSSSASTGSGSSTQSSGSATVGGGNATGTGNSSSTDFSQGASSSNSSSGGGSSNSTTG